MKDCEKQFEDVLEGKSYEESGLTPTEYLESRDMALRGLNPELKKKAEWIVAWHSQESRRDLVRRYELGLQIKEVKDDEEANGDQGRFGQSPLKNLGKALPWCKSLVYEVLRLVRAFTPEEVEELAKKRTQLGQPLSWSHINLLAQVTDKAQRQQLIDQALREDWTTDKLAAMALGVGQGAKATKRGGHFAAPKNFDAALDQQAKAANQFLGRAEKVWAGEHSLTRLVTDLASSEITLQRKQKLEAHVETLAKLAEAAQKQREQAQEALDRVRAVLSRSETMREVAALEALERACALVRGKKPAVDQPAVEPSTFAVKADGAATPDGDLVRAS